MMHNNCTILPRVPQWWTKQEQCLQTVQRNGVVPVSLHAPLVKYVYVTIPVGVTPATVPPMVAVSYSVEPSVRDDEVPSVVEIDEDVLPTTSVSHELVAGLLFASQANFAFQ